MLTECPGKTRIMPKRWRRWYQFSSQLSDRKSTCHRPWHVQPSASALKHLFVWFSDGGIIEPVLSRIRTITPIFIFIHIPQPRPDVAWRAAPGGAVVLLGAAGRQPRLADQCRRPPVQLEVRLRPHGRRGHGQAGQGVARCRRAAGLQTRQPQGVSGQNKLLW